MGEARGRRGCCLHADCPPGRHGTARPGTGDSNGDSNRLSPARPRGLSPPPSRPPQAGESRTPHGHAPGNKYVSRGPARPRHHHGSPQRRAARPGPARRPAYPPGSALCLRPARPRVTAPAALRRGAAAEARPGGLKPNPDRRPRGSARIGSGGAGGSSARGPAKGFPAVGEAPNGAGWLRAHPSPGWDRAAGLALPSCPFLFLLFVKSGHSPVSFSGCGVRRASCCRSAGPNLMQARSRSRSCLPLLAPQRTTIIPAGSAR